jgi:hypothetical protein
LLPLRGSEQARPGKVYLITYRLEDYPDLARDFHIWPYPRGHFRHVALLPFRVRLHAQMGRGAFTVSAAPCAGARFRHVPFVNPKP